MGGGGWEWSRLWIHAIFHKKKRGPWVFVVSGDGSSCLGRLNNTACLFGLVRPVVPSLRSSQHDRAAYDGLEAGVQGFHSVLGPGTLKEPLVFRTRHHETNRQKNQHLVSSASGFARVASRRHTLAPEKTRRCWACEDGTGGTDLIQHRWYSGETVATGY